jgi:hypothetical protein
MKSVNRYPDKFNRDQLAFFSSNNFNQNQFKI